MSSVLLVGHSAEYQSRLRALFGNRLNSIDSRTVEAELEAHGAEAPDVALIGPFLPLEEARRLVQLLRVRFLDLQVVLVDESAPTAGTVASVGVDAVVSPTAGDEAVLALVPSTRNEGVLAAAEAMRDPSRVIAVVSPKGGQGKTTIAANLAVALARLEPERVVLVDADMQFGDVENLFNLTPTHRITDMVEGAVTTDHLILKTYLTRHPAGFHVVCGATNPVDGDRVTGEQLANLLAQLASEFRYVVIDTTPALGEHALTALDAATDVVVVSQLSVPTLRAVRTELDVLEGIGAVPPQRHVVLSIAGDGNGLRKQDAEAILGAPVDVIVPRSNAVQLAANRGVPLLLDAPKDAASRAVLDLAARITGTPAKALRTLSRKAAS